MVKENNLNDYIYYRLSKEAYNSTQSLKTKQSKWKAIKVKGKTQDKHAGFQAKVYKSGNTIVVAFAGTDKTDPGDLINDVGIAIPLLKKALDSSNLKESKLYIFQAQNSLK